MKRLDVAQTITILANVGVIAGIVFLAYELRQNNELLVAETSRAQFDLERERRMLRMQEIDLILKSRSGAPMTEAELARLSLLADDTLETFRWQFREFRAGRLPDDFIDLSSWGAVWRLTPRLDSRFEERKGSFDPEFVRFVEENVISGLDE